MSYSTRNWLIGILVGAWIASFIVGYLHVAELISEPSNPIAHTFKDWILVAIFLVPVSYLLARFLPRK